MTREDLVAALRRWSTTARADRPYFISSEAKVRHELFIATCDQAATLLEGDAVFVKEWADRFGFLATTHARDSVDSIDEVASILRPRSKGHR